MGIDLATAAAQQANAIREYRRFMNTVRPNPSAFNKSSMNYWKSRLAREGNRIVQAAKNQGLHSNKFRVNTPEYFSLLVNMAR